MDASVITHGNPSTLSPTNVTLPRSTVPPGMPENYQNTFESVRDALRNADVAVRNAEEAFRSVQPSLGRGQSVVDLTTLSSPERAGLPSASNYAHIESARPVEPRFEQRWPAPFSISHFLQDPGLPDRRSFAARSAMTLPTARLPPRPLTPFRQERNIESDRQAIARQRQQHRTWERVQRHQRRRLLEEDQRQAADAERERLQRRQERRDRQLRQEREEEDLAAELSLALESQDDNLLPAVELDIDDADSIPLSGGNADDDLQTSHSGRSTQRTLQNSCSPEESSLTTQPTTVADTQDAEMEVIDLTSEDAVAQQKVASLIANQAPMSDPTDGLATGFSSYKCSICMDTPENATTTVCGHLFCHKCILDALKYSLDIRTQEGIVGRARTGQGLCPTCRKALHIRDTGTGRGLIPLEMKVVKRKDYEAQKKKARMEKETGEKIVAFAMELGRKTAADKSGQALAIEDAETQGKPVPDQRGASISVKGESEPELGSSTTGARHFTRKRTRPSTGESSEFEDQL